MKTPQRPEKTNLRLSAEKDSEVTFDEVVTARKERSQQYKRKQPLDVLLEFMESYQQLYESLIIIMNQYQPLLTNV